jgi:hypothetical protein
MACDVRWAWAQTVSLTPDERDRAGKVWASLCENLRQRGAYVVERGTKLIYDRNGYVLDI